MWTMMNRLPVWLRSRRGFRWVLYVDSLIGLCVMHLWHWALVRDLISSLFCQTTNQCQFKLPSFIRPASTTIPTIDSSRFSSLNSVQEAETIYDYNEKPLILRLKQDGLSLQSMPPFVQSSRPFVKASIRQNGLALQYASPTLRDDISLVMTAVSQNGLALQYASARLRNNTSIALIAVSHSGSALQYASRELRSNKQIVMAAILNEGCALEYASSALRNDEEVVTTAIRCDRNAVRYLGHEILGSLNEIMDVVKSGKKRTVLVWETWKERESYWNANRMFIYFVVEERVGLFRWLLFIWRQSIWHLIFTSFSPYIIM